MTIAYTRRFIEIIKHNRPTTIGEIKTEEQCIKYNIDQSINVPSKRHTDIDEGMAMQCMKPGGRDRVIGRY